VTIWVKKKIFTEGLEFLHVAFDVMEKHSPAFFPLVFASFIKRSVGKLIGFFAYAISRKRGKA